MHIGFWWTDLKEKSNLEDLGVDKMDIKEIGWEGVDWIDLAQDRDSGEILRTR